jgi:hypothetical protein
MPRPAVAFVTLLATVLVPPGATATPPDHLVTTLDALCTGGDRVALMVRSTGNAGTYYITDNRWHLVMIDAASGDVQWRDHGAVVVNTVNMLEQGDEAEVSYRTGDAPPLGRSLGEWGMESCGVMDGSYARGAVVERFGVEVSEAGVFLTLGGHRRELEIAGTWDPSELSVDQFPWGEGQPAMQSHEPVSFLGNSEGLVLVRTLPLPTRTVFVVERVSEFGHTQVVVATRRAVADRAMAWLVNARGLDDHRAGRPELSMSWFATALDLDPGFDTARYNLACALALLEDPAGAVLHLKGLPVTEELAEKIAGDADFEPVRSAAGFVEFVEGLP